MLQSACGFDAQMQPLLFGIYAAVVFQAIFEISWPHKAGATTVSLFSNQTLAAPSACSTRIQLVLVRKIRLRESALFDLLIACWCNLLAGLFCARIMPALVWSCCWACYVGCLKVKPDRFCLPITCLKLRGLLGFSRSILQPSELCRRCGSDTQVEARNLMQESWFDLFDAERNSTAFSFSSCILLHNSKF